MISALIKPALPAVENVTEVLETAAANLGHKAFYAVLPMFVADLEYRMRRIERALDNNYFDALRLHAASLRTSTANMGFHQFSGMLRQMEYRASQLMQPDDKLRDMVISATEEMLTRMIDRLPS